MDFYLTDIKTNNRIHLPVNPTLVPVPGRAIMQEYNFMDKGTRVFPNGNEVEEITLEGFLPHKSLRNMSYVKSWRSPTELVKELDKHRTSGQKLKLLITETSVNMDVYIREFTPVWGHVDRVPYTMVLVRAEDCIIPIVGSSQSNTMQSGSNASARPEPPKSNTYVVKSGDTLWAIAQKHLGNGSRYTEIHIENKPPLSSNPSLIYPGQVLKLPV